MDCCIMSKNSPVLFQLLLDAPRQFGIPGSGGENRISSNVITVLLNIFGQNQPIMQIADEARAFFRSCRVNQIAQAAKGSLSHTLREQHFKGLITVQYL